MSTDRKLPESVWNVIACPSCGVSLKRTDAGGVCGRCRQAYDYTNSGALDLRLRKERKYTYEFNIGTPLLPDEGFRFDLLPQRDPPEVDFRGLDVPSHLTKEILSHFPKAKANNSLVLDLGCGSTIHRGACEHAGYNYVGLDYSAPKAGILGDAHALPFVDESFEFILSIAVLEHIRFPWVMMREAYRVLQRNGTFIGTVAFLEPFHGDSYYHHTHLGTYNSLKEGGFHIEYVAPSARWSALVAQASMCLFPRMPSFLSTGIVKPVEMLHKAWWRIGRKFNSNLTDSRRILSMTGAFTFVACKKIAE